MITSDDMKKMLQVFATKQDLEAMEERLASKDDFNRVMNSVDKVLGELKSMREEQIFHQSSHDTVDERLTGIEQTPTVAHELKKKN